MPFGADVVPDECRTRARASAWRASRSSLSSWMGSSGATVKSGSRSPATSRHLAISFSPPKLTIAFASVCSTSAAICVWLNIGGSGASTTPRCRQPSIATAASIEWRPSRTTTSTGADPGLGEAIGERDRGAAQLAVGHLALIEHERHAVGVLVRARIEIAPQIAVSPIALRVVPLGLRLEGQHRVGHKSLPRTAVPSLKSIQISRSCRSMQIRAI